MTQTLGEDGLWPLKKRADPATIRHFLCYFCGDFFYILSDYQRHLLDHQWASVAMQLHEEDLRNERSAKKASKAAAQSRSDKGKEKAHSASPQTPINQEKVHVRRASGSKNRSRDKKPPLMTTSVAESPTVEKAPLPEVPTAEKTPSAETSYTIGQINLENLPQVTEFIKELDVMKVTVPVKQVESITPKIKDNRKRSSMSTLDETINEVSSFKGSIPRMSTDFVKALASPEPISERPLSLSSASKKVIPRISQEFDKALAFQDVPIERPASALSSRRGGTPCPYEKIQVVLRKSESPRPLSTPIFSPKVQGPSRLKFDQVPTPVCDDSPKTGVVFESTKLLDTTPSTSSKCSIKEAETSHNSETLEEAVGLYKCDKCVEELNTKHLLIQHLINNHDAYLDRLMVNYYSGDTLLEHKTMNPNRCKRCKLEFTDPSRYLMHMIGFHRGSFFSRKETDRTQFTFTVTRMTTVYDDEITLYRE